MSYPPGQPSQDVHEHDIISLSSAPSTPTSGVIVSEPQSPTPTTAAPPPTKSTEHLSTGHAEPIENSDKKKQNSKVATNTGPIRREMQTNDEKPSAEQDVQRIVDDTVRKMRAQSERIQAAAIPWAESARDFAENQPVLFTFLAIFIALSFVPLCCFGAFMLGATLFILGFAAISICLTFVLVFSFAMAILIPVLLFTGFLSLCALSCLLTLFLANRLYVHVQASASDEVNYVNVKSGVKSWLQETQDRIVSPPPSSERGRRRFFSVRGRADAPVIKAEWDEKGEKWDVAEISEKVEFKQERDNGTQTEVSAVE